METCNPYMSCKKRRNQPISNMSGAFRNLSVIATLIIFHQKMLGVNSSRKSKPFLEKNRTMASHYPYKSRITTFIADN